MDWASDIITFLLGGLTGSFITYQVQKKRMTSQGSGSVVDQSGARAGGDIAGRDKRG